MKALIPFLGVAAFGGALLSSGASAAEFEFESPIMLMAGDSPVKVENPGWSAPCWADADGDGKAELIVGQFAQGKMKVYAHRGNLNFGAGKWLQTVGGGVAEVPGVW